MGAGAVRVETADARALPEAFTDSFDAALVDPPCSGLGTVQSRPDLRWRASRSSVTELALVQRKILAEGARAVRPGGVLVYSVCTISQQEGPAVVDALLASRDDFRPEPLAERLPAYASAAVGPYLQLLPHREGTDGFFIARLRRAAS
jgi:16S rRNA (cytosine967-C5)-methyltransferase